MHFIFYELTNTTWSLAFVKLRVTEEAADETEKNVVGDEKPVVEEDAPDSNKENPANETEEKEPEDKVNVFDFHLTYFALYKIHFYSMIFIF
jgi:hypothetical protein